MGIFLLFPLFWGDLTFSARVVVYVEIWAEYVREAETALKTIKIPWTVYQGPWLLHKVVAQSTLRIYEVTQVFRFVEGVWLHR